MAAKKTTDRGWRPRLVAGTMARRLTGGVVSLLRGMGLTLGYFLNPGKVVTQQYPENRETLTMFPRFRGRLTLVREDNGDHRCVACGLCEKACPNGTISVLASRDVTGRKLLARYVYRLGQCTLCHLCVEACPYGAIAMGQEFEMAVYERGELELVLNEEGG